MKNPVLCALVIISWLVLAGFNLDHAIVPKDEILSGGPPKDGIPGILNPKFIEADKTDFLKPQDGVIAVKVSGQAKAYPLKILTWHEAVNDTIRGTPILVTF
jgi:hypothetical protein